MPDGFDWGSALAGLLGGSASLIGALLLERTKSKWGRARTAREEQLKECRSALATFVTFHDPHPVTGYRGTDDQGWAIMYELIEVAFGPDFAENAMKALKDGRAWRNACANRMRARIREIEVGLGIPRRVDLKPEPKPTE